MTFLRQVRDVTDEAQAIRDSLEKANSLGIFGTRKVYGILERKYGRDTPFEVECASMWKGKKYLLFYYETYKDVRLVGAPPVKIGAFGGEQDNWGWPQHKNDFALYRVYGDAKRAAGGLLGEQRAHHAPQGAECLDEWHPRQGLRHGDRLSGPHQPLHVVAGRARKGARDQPVVIKSAPRPPRHHAAPHGGRPDVRLMYSDKYFNISDYADYAKWENICLRRYDVIGIRAAEEARLAAWIDADPARRAEYGDLLANLKKRLRGPRRSRARESSYYQETMDSPERRDDDGQPSRHARRPHAAATASPRCRTATRTSRA